ncbi:MAG: YdeI/OmpD-associated family protein [Cyclobacteriaceae bacterium]|nr:YdeI/OmpD-associated family protein [Cyclobacteriaceae bacterium]
MKPVENKNTFYATSSTAWRNWLKKNHLRKENIWLIIYKKESGISSVYYPQAVDEALCFGWIDSVPNKRDANSYYLFFSKRKPQSYWSKVNKLKVAQLIKLDKMMPQGMKMVELAKQSGTWEALNKVDELVIPDEMANLFRKYKKAKINFDNFPPSTKRGILQWIYNAKQDVTRLKRITETVALATQNIRANQYQPKK